MKESDSHIITFTITERVKLEEDCCVDISIAVIHFLSMVIAMDFNISSCEHIWGRSEEQVSHPVRRADI